MRNLLENLKILQLEHDSDEYWEAVALRDEVLRQPLGLVFSPKELAAESGETHLAAYNKNEELLACLSLKKADKNAVKMRQVAVCDAYQRMGVGQMLVKASEKKAVEQGFSEMILHARETAVPFYLKMGYKTVGDTFEEVGLPHFKMTKKISA